MFHRTYNTELTMNFDKLHSIDATSTWLDMQNANQNDPGDTFFGSTLH